MLKLLKLPRIAWSPFLASTRHRLVRGCSQDCYLNSTFLQANEDRLRPDPLPQPVSSRPACSLSTSSIQEDSNKCTTSNIEGQAEVTFDLAKFYAALDEINFFKTSPSGAEDPGQLSKASQLFDDALLEVRKSGRKTARLVDLAEFFKSKGSDFMRSKLHLKAVELYTGAIALSRKKNAIYYCNRAAAYILLNMRNEAVKDCMKSIAIDPKYSKAYSRLGSSYFAMENYHDALYKGYLKGTNIYMLTLGGMWSTSTIDLYLHQRFKMKMPCYLLHSFAHILSPLKLEEGRNDVVYSFDASVGSMLVLDSPYVANSEQSQELCLEYGSATQVYLVPIAQHEEQVLHTPTQVRSQGPRLSCVPVDNMASQVTLPRDLHGSVDFSKYPFRPFPAFLQEAVSTGDLMVTRQQLYRCAKHCLQFDTTPGVSCTVCTCRSVCKVKASGSTFCLTLSQVFASIWTLVAICSGFYRSLY